MHTTGQQKNIRPNYEILPLSFLDFLIGTVLDELFESVYFPISYKISIHTSSSSLAHKSHSARGTITCLIETIRNSIFHKINSILLLLLLSVLHRVFPLIFVYLSSYLIALCAVLESNKIVHAVNTLLTITHRKPEIT